MSSGFRARRPASPPLGHSNSSPKYPPHPKDRLDADERRALASRGVGPHTKMHPLGGLKMTPGEWKLLLLLVIVAAGVRLFRISQPNSVVFDEVHFGKFASKYIKTQYFVDVHPPLAKLLLTLAAFVFGYDGQFDFKDIGKVYENVPYVAMRMVPGILGVAVVPISYLTLRALDCRATSALLGSLLITFENALITQSRHILLDSPLVFFTSLTILVWVFFTNEDRYQPFSEEWWLWLTLTGLGLGAVVSSKWVGLFTIATVGFSTILQLWNLLGDLHVSPRLFMRHFFARALCLIVVPTLFYMFMFEIHFLVLENSGDGDGFMSSEFQHTLGGRSMSDTFADVALGSRITIRHLNTQGGYIHSHPHNYPAGSKQQQVTLYPHRDTNNDWIITNITSDGGKPFDFVNNPLQYVTAGMQITLQHVETEKRLHSHDFRPPKSEVDFQNEVSAYGVPDFPGDANDNWIMEIVSGDKKDLDSWKRLKTLRTHFRLKHTLQGCYLFSHKVKLPDWGFEQQEVTCNKNAVKDNSLWYVETSTHPLFTENFPKVNYKLPGFFSKFLELQQVMWTTNAGLTDRHTFDSRPNSWPSLRRGINFWVKDHRQIYLIGNPVIWWLSSLSAIVYIVVRGILILRAQRGFRDFENSKIVKYDAVCGFLFAGWALHYLPFYLMSRQLFLHHYLPALYFSILLCCAVFDILTASARPRTRLYIAAGVIFVVIWTYVRFSPLTYGLPWTKQDCESAKWRKTWDFSCNDFLENYADYSNVGLATPTQASAPTAGGGGRGAVIVENPILANDPQQLDATSAIGNQPQPGHDIFAKHPQEEIKSEAQPKIETPAEEKEVSKVLLSTEVTTTREDATTQTETVEAENAAIVESKDDGSGGQPETLSKLETAGPLEHDQAEAEAARNELFGDVA